MRDIDWPFDLHPNCRNSCAKCHRRKTAPTTSVDRVVLSHPDYRRIRSDCCARAASGHAAAAPPSSVMNSRRLIRSPRRRGRAAWRHVEAERLGGLEIDHQFVLGRRLHRQVGGLLALEDAIDVAGRAAVLVDDIRPIGDQAAVGDVESSGVDRGQFCAGPPA